MSKPIDRIQFYRNGGLASNGVWICPYHNAKSLNLIPRAALKCTEQVFTWRDKSGFDLGFAHDLEKALKEMHSERYVPFAPSNFLVTSNTGEFFRIVVAERHIFEIDERYYNAFSPSEVCPETDRFKGAFTDSFIMGAVLHSSFDRHLQADIDLLQSTLKKEQ